MVSCDFCHVDNKEQLKSCICTKVSYCSKECQVKDWKRHKPSCPPFITRESPDMGRGQFATRKIKEGEMIMMEYPFLTFLSGMDLTEFQTKLYPYIDDDKKEKVLKLHDRSENFKNLESRTLQNMISKNPAVKNWLKPKSDDEKILSILFSNCYILSSPTSDSSSRSELGLYSEISLINHSCIPNAMLSIVRGDPRRSQVRALRDINKDEEIVTSYYDTTEFNYGSRQFRRQKLLENPGFWCQCSECSLQGEENERKRQQIRDIETEGFQLERVMCDLTFGDSDFRKSLKKQMKLAQLKVNLVQELDIRQMIVTELCCFAYLAAFAKLVGISAPDSDIFKREAFKYAKKFGESQLFHYNRFIGKLEEMEGKAALVAQIFG